MRKKEIINFAPEGVKGKKKPPLYVGVIILACLGVFFISVFIIFAKNDFDINKVLGARRAEPSTVACVETTVSPAKTVTSMVSEFSDTVNFLILCSEDKELNFCQIICVSPSGNKIKIKPVSLDFTFDFSGTLMELKEAFASFSIKEIVGAFLRRDIPIAKYLCFSEDNFVKFMQRLGPTPINITGEYEFNVDAVKYTFRSGVQNLTADMLLKYLKFAGAGEAKLRLQAVATADILKRHFTMENFNKGEDFFAALINFVDSDITVFDYTAVEEVIRSMLSSDTEITAIS